MGGTQAMRCAGLKYLPKEPKEPDDAYSTRIERSTLFNAFRKTVRDMTGKVFQKAIVLQEDVPAPIVEWAENIDLAGRHINVFARDAFFDAMQPGIGFILAEMPKPVARPDGRPATVADEQAAGIRPYLCYVRAENLIGWRSELVDGVETLTQARIRERVLEDDGEFDQKEVDQIRVLTPGAWALWRKSTEGAARSWYLYDEGITSVSKITLAPIYINRTGFMTGAPPLEDLADLNVAHWQSQSDQRNILHVARVPILFGAGWQDDAPITIGAGTMARSSDPNARLEWVEHSGAAIGAGDKDLQNLEFQMQTQGLQLLIPQPGGKSATGEVRDDAKENSPLAMMARALQDALEQSLGFMAEYAALGDSGGSVVVNTDFGIGALAQLDVPQIVAAYTANLVDAQTAIEELKRRNFLSDDVDPETVMDRVAAAAPALDATRGMDLNGGAANG